MSGGIQSPKNTYLKHYNKATLYHHPTQHQQVYTLWRKGEVNYTPVNYRGLLLNLSQISLKTSLFSAFGFF